MALKFNPTTGKLDVDGKVRITNGADNVIVRFDGTNAIQGYTSNPPTITDAGVPSFNVTAHVRSERIGENSSVSGADATAFGWGANSGVRGFAGGRSASVAPAAVAGVAIGYISQCTGTNAILAIRGIASGTQSLALGGNATNTRATCLAGAGVASGTFSLAAAYGAQATGESSISVGAESVASKQYSFALGYRSLVDHFSSIAMGGIDATTTADYQMVIGGTSPVLEYWFGTTNEIITAAGFPKNFSFNFPSPLGTDASPRDVEFNAPAGTGSGASGSILFRYAPAGVTGSTTNPHANAFEIDSEGQNISHRAVSKPIETISTDTTLDASHYTVLVDTSTGNVTVTLPSNVDGRIYKIKKISSDSNRVVFSGTVDGVTTRDLTVQYESVTIQNLLTSWYVL